MRGALRPPGCPGSIENSIRKGGKRSNRRPVQISRPAVIKPAMLEEVCDLPHHQRMSHDEGVGVVDNYEIAHLGQRRALHRDHTIVRSVQEGGNHEIDAQITRNHANVESDRLQTIDDGLWSPSDFLAGRSGDPAVEGKLPEEVDEFAPLVRGGDHDKPASRGH